MRLEQISERWVMKIQKEMFLKAKNKIPENDLP